MKKYKIAVIGDIGQGEPVYNGQTAKTRDYLFYLSKRYGACAVCSVDTRHWKKKIISKTISLLKVMFSSQVLVLVLGKNGRRTILPLALLLKPLTRNKILFSIVGGSLMYEFDGEPKTVSYLKKVDENYVETKKFEDFLTNKGITNVRYSPVFSKRKSINDENLLKESAKKPFRFCTYSRVCKEKGISRAIDAVNEINKQADDTVCELDIYGVPQDDYKIEFETKISESRGNVHVYPYLDDSNAIETLSKHYMMLFPTYYDGEGFPIAIVECLKAGVPVIASDWHFNSEVILDGETGLIYQLDKQNELENKIKWAIANSDEVLNMKYKCLERALLFEPNQALSCVYDKIESM